MQEVKNYLPDDLRSWIYTRGFSSPKSESKDSTVLNLSCEKASFVRHYEKTRLSPLDNCFVLQSVP